MIPAVFNKLYRRCQRYSLKSLFLLMTVVALAIVGYQAYQAWFIRTYGGYYVATVLYDIRNGATVNEVARYFQHKGAVSATEMETVREVWKSRGGVIQRGDEVLLFSVESGHGAWLCFRKGKLVNHNYADYANPSMLSELNNQPYPPWAIR